jgi:hypothetical protein
MPDEPQPVCRYEQVKYGNYLFHAFSKVTLNKQNVYTEDNLVVKYVRCTLEVDFIITTETVTVTDPLYTGVDKQMDKIHEELQAPNKELKLYYHGMGTEMNIIGRAVTNTVGVNNALRHVPFNIFEGPFPEVLTWEPLAGNNAVRCKWRCVFNIATGPVKTKSGSFDNPEQEQQTSNNLGGRTVEQGALTGQTRVYAGAQTITDIVNNYINTIFDIAPEQSNSGGQVSNYLLSHTEEQEFEIDEDGTAVMTLTGELEFVGTGALVNRLKESPTAIPRLLQVLTHYFEPLHPLGFTRTQKYKFKKNKRSIEYTIVDREIKSDNPILPNILKADVSHSVSSSLLGGDVFEGSGFLTWNNVFEGTFTVRPGVWKGWAWLAMMTICRQRMAGTLPFQNEVNLKTKDALSGAIQDVAATGAERRHLLHNISIKENIYNRECSFTLKYLVITNLNALFVSTGLFYPVSIAWNGQVLPADLGKVPITVANQQHVFNAIPQSYGNQWGISREYMANAQNVFGYRGPLLPGYDMVFNPYDGWNPNRFSNDAGPRNPERSIVSSNATFDYDNVDSANTHTLAERRRNAHLETFGNLNFPFPENIDQAWGGNAPLKDVPGLPTSNFSTSPYKSYDPTNDSTYLKNVNPSQTWISYDTKFKLRRNENSVLFPSIQPQLIASRATTAVPATTSRDARVFNINGNNNAEPTTSGYEYSDVQVFGNVTTYVQFTGQALRVGYPVPCPTLVGCRNAGTGSGGGAITIQAYRVGEGNYTCYQVGKSADLPIFRGVWDITYALKGDPSCANISFEANRANYYA